ncbi:MAG: glycosyltransferase family 9 protein [Bdellovibrionales bacterium]
MYPGSEITLLCRKGLGDFFKKTKLVKKTIEFAKDGTSNWESVQKHVLAQSYELVLSPHQSFRSALLVQKIKADKKIGYLKWWNFFAFTHRVVRPMEFPEPLRLMALLEPIDEKVKTELQQLKESKTYLNSSEQGTVNFTREPKIPDLFSAQLKKLDLPNEESAIDKLIKEKVFKRIN